MDGRFVEVNKAYENLVGQTSGELFGLNFSNITPSQYKERNDEIMKDLRTTGRFGPFTKEYFRKGGKDRIKVTLWGAILEIGNTDFIWTVAIPQDPDMLHIGPDLPPSSPVEPMPIFGLTKGEKEPIIRSHSETPG